MTTPSVALGEVLADIRPGFASGDNLAEGVFQIRMNNLSRGGDFLLDKRRRVSSHSKQISKSLLQPGDVLFNATNSPGLVGKTAIFLGCDEPAVFSNHFIRLRAREHQLDARYLTRWLQREFQRGYFRAKCKQWVNQATFGQDRLVEMQIPLPRIEDQRRIASVLDAADGLRAKRRLVLAKLDSLMDAIFVDTFGEATNWPTGKLGDHVPTTSGGTPSRSRPDFFDGQIPWVKSGELASGSVTTCEEAISEEALASSSAKLMPIGTVLLAMYGATVGEVAVLGIEAATNQAVCCISPTESVTGPFLLGLLRTRKSDLVRQAAGGAQPNISQTIVRGLDIPLPPTATQMEYAQYVLATEELREMARSSAVELDALFASLQQRAFRGEL